MYAFGELLRGFRQREGLTQSQLSEDLEVHRNSISDWECSKYLPGTRELVLRLAKHLMLTSIETDQLLHAAHYPLEFGTTVGVNPPVSPPLVDPASDETLLPTADESSIFVARENELAQLGAFLQNVLTQQQGRIIFVTGEAGSGKSALVQEFVARAMVTHTDLVVAGGNCNAYTGVGDPYLPFRAILELLTDDSETRWAAEPVIRRHGRRLRMLLPHTSHTLVSVGADLIDTFISGAALLARAERLMTSDRELLAQLRRLVTRYSNDQQKDSPEQRNLFEQYSRVLRTLAKQYPLLLILDDLQWADQGSIDLLSHLGRGLAGTPILLVGIYRSSDVALGRDGNRHPLAPVVNELRAQLGEIRIDLKQTSGQAFVNAIVDSEPNQLPATFRAALYQHTQGHALFTVEILRSMQRRGDLIQNEHGAWIVGPTLNWHELPARVEGAIEERIQRLPEPLQEALRVASVEGENFLAEVTAQVQEIDGWTMVRQLSTTLDQRHRLVRGEATQRLGDHRLSQYRFRHILFQQYLYNSLDTVMQPILHEKVGQALEQFYGEQSEPVAVQLAHHFQLAGVPDKAITYHRQAGQRALTLSAHAEALAHFQAALTMLETMPATAERIHQELDLQTSLGVALIVRKGYAAPEVVQVYTRALALSEQADDTTQLCRALTGLWLSNFVRAALAEARTLGEQLLELAERKQDPTIRLQAYRALSGTLCTMAEFTATQAHCEQGIALYHRQQYLPRETVQYGQDPGVVYLAYSSLARWFLGYPDQSLAQSQASLYLANTLDHPFSRAFAYGIAAMLHHLRREAASAQLCAETAWALAAEKEFIQWIVQGTMLQGWAQIQQERQPTPIAQMGQALDQWQATGARLIRPYFLLLLAEAHGIIGEAATGVALLDEALTAIHATGERWTEAETYRLRGELLLQSGDPEDSDSASVEAESWFQQALATARHQQAKLLELRALMSLSRLVLHSETEQAYTKRSEAHQQLAQVYQGFTEGFDTPDLIAAAALLEELSSD